MTTTAQPTAEDATLTLLQANVTLAGLSGGQGAPQMGQPADPHPEHVWVRDETEITLAPILTGGTRAEEQESFLVRIDVFVANVGQDWKAARDRVHVLVAIVQEIIRANVRLTNTVQYAFVERIHRLPAQIGERTGALATVDVRCEAYLEGSA